MAFVERFHCNSLQITTWEKSNNIDAEVLRDGPAQNQFQVNQNSSDGPIQTK